MTPLLLRLLERRLAGRVPASRLAPLLGDLLEDYHDRRAERRGWRGWIARADPRLDEVGVDASVLIFTAALSVLTGILFGIAPALRRLRAPLLDALRTSSTSPAAGLHLRRGLHLQGLLVIAEIAMAVTLFIGGGLLIHSFMPLRRTPPPPGRPGGPPAPGSGPPPARASPRYVSQRYPRSMGAPRDRGTRLHR